MDNSKNEPTIEKRYGILTLKELKSLKLFSSLNNDIYEACYSNASFDFTLGDEYFFPKQYQDSLEFFLSNHKSSDGNIPTEEKNKILKQQIRTCKEDGVLRLPKFSSVVISTYEIVTLPNNVAGRFDLRVRWAMAGLILQVGTQIEPGYSGRLWGLLHNFSGEDVIISFHTKDHRLLTGEFYYTSEDAEPTKDNNDKSRDLYNLLTKYPVKSGSLQNYFDEFKGLHQSIEEKVRSEIKSLDDFGAKIKGDIQKQIDSEIAEIKDIKKEVESTRNRVQDVNNEVQNTRSTTTSWVLLIITFFVSVTVPILVNKMTFDKDDYMLFDHTTELKMKMDSLNKTVDKVNLENQQLKLSLDSIIKHK